MAKKHPPRRSVSQKQTSWTDPYDAPPLKRDFFARATLNKGGKPVRD